ncbi:MAG: CRISPR-associated endonuclease Cas1 [Nitrospirae bacterium]|nr:CRISPR-associated endonuclease Cas1 [Nitrospirota bacterium]
MGKTLYLSEGSKALHVHRDGPSVWITAKERAGQRIPARLISRVVIIGNVLLDAGAVTLFTEQKIPVVFMSRCAEEVAVAMPCNQMFPALHTDQKIFLDNEQRMRKYKDWAEARRVMVERNMLSRLYRQLAGALKYRMAEKDYQEVLSYLKPSNEEKWEVVKAFVDNLFRCLIIEHIIASELDPHLGVLHRGWKFGLARDIGHILEAERDLQCLQFFKSSVEKPAVDRKYRVCNITDSVIKNIIHRFENRRGEISRMIAETLIEIRDLIRETGK